MLVDRKAFSSVAIHPWIRKEPTGMENDCMGPPGWSFLSVTHTLHFQMGLNGRWRRLCWDCPESCCKKRYRTCTPTIRARDSRSIRFRVQCVLVIRESFTTEYGSRVFHSSPCGPLFLHIEPSQLSLITKTHCTETSETWKCSDAHSDYEF